MRNKRIFKMSFLMLALMLMLTACGGEKKEADTSQPEKLATEEKAAEETATNENVEIKDIHGTVSVPVNPKNVIALDNRTFDTLSDWGIELVAVPKDVMPEASSYVKDEAVGNIGNHREPNLELIAAADPELVIIGQRFASYYEEIKGLVPNAAVIDLSFDVSGEKNAAGESLVNGLKDSTRALGQIFDKNKEADKLIATFDEAIENAKSAYNGSDTIMSIVVSGGEIGFSAPSSGRVWGPMYEVFNWKSALEVDGSTSDHKGDDISVEAIANSNPDWIFVLDRDAAVSSGEEMGVPAKDVIENSPALKNVNAVTKGQIIYAPNDTYTNESMQTYIKLFNEIASTLAK